MDPWVGWPVERTLLALVAVLYAGIWVQVTLMHWAGGFAARAMWAPVIEGPVIVLATAIAVAARQEPWGWIAVAALSVGVLGGLYGTFRHLRGVHAHIGGFTLRNFLAGPPPMLPVAFALAGALGLVVLVAGEAAT
jgi:hypothetical protein